MLSVGRGVGNLKGLGDKSRIQGYFDSIFRQNYNNYHIVWIDDASKDGSIEKAIQYVKENYP